MNFIISKVTTKKEECTTCQKEIAARSRSSAVVWPSGKVDWYCKECDADALEAEWKKANNS